MQKTLGLFALAALLMLAIESPQPASAQPTFFGAADDPAERIQTVWWRNESLFNIRAGLSLIGAEWHAAGQATAGIATPFLTAKLEGTLRGGINGLYQPDIDENYDFLRLLQFARYNASPATPVHVRAGPIHSMRLGTGHLVDLYRSDVAWDDRTIGGEFSLQFPFGHVGAFTNDVRLRGPTGGRIALEPFSAFNLPVIRSVEIGGSLVSDLSLREDAADVTAYAIDGRFAILDLGGVFITPLMSYASYLNYGWGASAGISFESPNLMDVARFHFRILAHRSSDEFIPGLFDTFYDVNNHRARIVNADAYFADTEMTDQESASRQNVIGTMLDDAPSSTALESELRVLVFDQMELRTRFRRDYGPQPLSVYNLRMFYQATDQLRFDFTLARRGLTSFFSTFRSFDDETALRLRGEYRLFDNFWIHADAQYTYEQIGQLGEETALYLAQRRFEPMAGFRFRF